MEADDGSGTVISAVRGWRESGEGITEELTVEKNGNGIKIQQNNNDYWTGMFEFIKIPMRKHSHMC